MKNGNLLPATLLLIIVLLLGINGCKTGDIWGTLTKATEYIGIVGQNMQAQGWDFPTTPLAWAKYIKDLKASITEAQDCGVYATGAVRDFEREILAIPEPDMKKLNEAFDSNPHW